MTASYTYNSQYKENKEKLFLDLKTMATKTNLN